MSNKVHKQRKRKNRFSQFGSRPTAGSAKLSKPRKVAGLPMLVDGEPIRRATRQAHEKIRARMEAMERQIDCFERQDLVAYERWLHLSFGPFLADLRESASAIAAKEDILDRVEEYQIWDNISAARAYAMVKNEMESPASDVEHESDSDDFDDESDEDLHNLYEAASYMYEQETGDEAPDFESFKDALGIENTMTREKENKADPGSARLKKLYRKIARILHPDFSDSFSLREQRLWHRAQEAYKAGDLIALETVFSHIEAASAGPLFASTVSELMDSTREMRMRVEYLEKDLYQARQHPAWRFTQNTKAQMESLHKRVGREIEQTLRQAKAHLADVEAELQRLENALSRMTARKSKKRKSKNSAVTSGQTGFNF
jgi:hypothetical protein